MPRVRLALLALVLAGCTSAGGSASVPPASATQAPAPASGAPGASGACIDPGEFGDLGETVVVALQGVDAALKAQDATKASEAATTAVAAMGKFADLVGAAAPDAASEVRTAAADLDKAKGQFPGGSSLVAQAEAELNKGLTDAQAGKCPG